MSTTSLAALRGNTHITCHNYREIIQKLNPGAPVWQDDFDEMLIKISTLLKKFDIPIESDLNNEISYVLWARVRQKRSALSLL